MIQVELPKWLGVDDDGNWFLFNIEPVWNPYAFKVVGAWEVEHLIDQIRTKVTEIDYDGKHALYQYVDGKWVKV